MLFNTVQYRGCYLAWCYPGKGEIGIGRGGWILGIENRAWAQGIEDVESIMCGPGRTHHSSILETPKTKKGCLSLSLSLPHTHTYTPYTRYLSYFNSLSHLQSPSSCRSSPRRLSSLSFWISFSFASLLVSLLSDFLSVSVFSTWNTNHTQSTKFSAKNIQFWLTFYCI